MKETHTDSKKRLEHIVKAIADIEKYVQNENLKSFCNNDLLNDAVLFNFSVIGEAIIHIECEILEKYNYPWYKIRAFRNMIAHEYFEIKMDAVWLIIKKNLPELKALIYTILKTEF